MYIINLSIKKPKSIGLILLNFFSNYFTKKKKKNIYFSNKKKKKNLYSKNKKKKISLEKERKILIKWKIK
jgi:hypothetical protein